MFKIQKALTTYLINEWRNETLRVVPNQKIAIQLSIKQTEDEYCHKNVLIPPVFYSGFVPKRYILFLHLKKNLIIYWQQNLSSLGLMIFPHDFLMGILPILGSSRIHVDGYTNRAGSSPDIIHVAAIYSYRWNL